MIIINRSARFNYLPKYKKWVDGEVWILELKFLRLQVSIYSKFIADGIVDLINEQSKASRP